MLPTLRSARLTLRPATADDAPPIAQMLAHPELARWWGDKPVGDVLEHIRTQPSWAIDVDGAVAGWLHVHVEEDPQYPCVSFDISIAAERVNRGLGREALGLAIAHFARAGHHRFAIDPAADNERAIRCYAAVGFKPVGIMRHYERAPDGRWRDGLLMDLLADEL